MSVTVNVAEGTGARAGRRRSRYGDALRSARERIAGLEAAEAVGKFGPLDDDVRCRFDPIIGPVVNLVR